MYGYIFAMQEKFFTNWYFYDFFSLGLVKDQFILNHQMNLLVESQPPRRFLFFQNITPIWCFMLTHEYQGRRSHGAFEARATRQAKSSRLSDIRLTPLKCFSFALPLSLSLKILLDPINFLAQCVAVIRSISKSVSMLPFFVVDRLFLTVLSQFLVNFQNSLLRIHSLLRRKI